MSLYIGFSKGLFYGIFHSISAFCNAGFDILEGDSIVMFACDKIFNITLMVLISIGGLGFLVWDDISRVIGNAIRKRSNIFFGIKKFSLHTKIVLIMQIVLFLIGTLGFYMFEKDNQLSIADYSLDNKILVSAFQSISARTAGLYSTNMETLNVSTKLFMIVLMFIGGAPGSMAGGLKTVTFLVIIAGFISRIRGRKNITMFKKTISKNTYEKAFEIFLIMIVFLYISVFVISCNLTSSTDFINILFDTTSSIATVGLSTGAISNMNLVSIIVIMLLMYIGRVGTITTALAFVLEKPKENDAIIYSTEEIIVG